jgi:signal transduction histidine kinase
MWGVLCLSLGVWGKADDFLLLTLVGAGMTAGALATVISYFPAYLAYAVPIAIPMALVSLAHPDKNIAANGVLILVYFAVVVLAARNSSRAINRSIALQVDLEETSRSLEKTRVERDTARKEKWSTLAQLSHELRTPLNAIMGFSEAMTGEYFGALGSPRYREYAANVLAGGKHLTRLVEELLELSRSESGQLELREVPVELDILIASCIDIMQAEADGAQITMTRHLARGLPLVRADKTKLRQMVLNLLSNAIKFTPAGGQVTASAFPAPGGGIAVVVQDTGIGMSDEEIAVALTPFGRVSSSVNDSTPGMGLGLPMVERLAQLHGAELAIASEPGFGTRCTIWFPAERVIGEAAAPEGAVCANTFAA